MEFVSSDRLFEPFVQANDHVPAGDAVVRVGSFDGDDPGEVGGDEDEGLDAGESGGGTTAFGPRTAGTVVGAVDGVGGVEDGILEVWSLGGFVGGWLEERVDFEVDIEESAFKGVENRGVCNTLA